MVLILSMLDIYVSISFIIFFIVPFMNLMHASACPLLCWFYSDDTACHMPSILQKFLNISKIKLVLVSENLAGQPIF